MGLSTSNCQRKRFLRRNPVETKRKRDLKAKLEQKMRY